MLFEMTCGDQLLVDPIPILLSAPMIGQRRLPSAISKRFIKMVVQDVIDRDQQRLVNEWMMGFCGQEILGSTSMISRLVNESFFSEILVFLVK